jgi:hypothetical protein
MVEKQNRYYALEKFLTKILFVDLACFIAYLVFAGMGIRVARIICAVAAILIALYSLWTLYCAKELLRPRSLWMTCAFASVTACTVVSLICNFPAP